MPAGDGLVVLMVVVAPCLMVVLMVVVAPCLLAVGSGVLTMVMVWGTDGGGSLVIVVLMVMVLMVVLD